MLEYKNLDQALVELSGVILRNGQWRETRGFRCLELDFPVLMRITDPSDRYITLPERKWNKHLPFVESLWLASGTNHLDMVTKYVKNMANFSDDGQFMRAGYGTRIRAYTGNQENYKVRDPKYRRVTTFSGNTVDQLKFVVDILKKDKDSRQALITIHDPAKDSLDSSQNLVVSKDQPCTRSLQFMVNKGKLDMTVHMRSNDLIWGFSAVNITNFTFMQEYVSQILNIPVGDYYHFANNLHVYEDKLPLVEELSKLKYDTSRNPYFYQRQFNSLEAFDNEVVRLFQFDELISRGESVDHIEFKTFMFQDWSSVLRTKWDKEFKPNFINPNLTNLFTGKMPEGLGSKKVYKGKKFSANTHIVKTETTDGKLVGYYEVYSVKGYMKRVEADGKVPTYLGQTNNEGVL